MSTALHLQSICCIVMLGILMRIINGGGKSAVTTLTTAVTLIRIAFESPPRCRAAQQSGKIIAMANPH